MRAALLLPAVILLIPRAAAAQGNPVGPEFRVNTFTTNDQRLSSVAGDPSGNFVVMWTSDGQDGSSNGVFGQRFLASGATAGPEFRVNSFTTFGQYRPSVAAASAGSFVAVWQDESQDASSWGVFGQRYASSGAPVGPEFRVNSFTTNFQYRPSVAAADSSGNFVVVWESFLQDGSDRGVFGQRYASTGAPLGPEFRVNTVTTGPQGVPSVTSDSAGNFTVIWQGDDGLGYGVFGQRYASSGAALGPEFRVNTFTTAFQGRPSVDADSSGNFVVVWESAGQDGSASGVFGQRYAATGAPLGGEFRVNSYVAYDQSFASVASDPDGNFVVAWQGAIQDGSSYGVFGQRYAGSGAPLGPEFRVNTFTTSVQSLPSVAADTSGNFRVVWQSQAQDGSAFGVFGQRYDLIVPVELLQFRVE